MNTGVNPSEVDVVWEGKVTLDGRDGPQRAAAVVKWSGGTEVRIKGQLQEVGPRFFSLVGGATRVYRFDPPLPRGVARRLGLRSDEVEQPPGLVAGTLMLLNLLPEAEWELVFKAVEKALQRMSFQELVELRHTIPRDSAAKRAFRSYVGAAIQHR